VNCCLVAVFCLKTDAEKLKATSLPDRIKYSCSLSVSSIFLFVKTESMQATYLFVKTAAIFVCQKWLEASHFSTYIG
jgi:hypothetical protein